MTTNKMTMMVHSHSHSRVRSVSIVAVAALVTVLCSNTNLICQGFQHGRGSLSSHASFQRAQFSRSSHEHGHERARFALNSAVEAGVSADSAAFQSPEVVKAEQLKAELMSLSTETDRGFKASKPQQREALKMIDQLAKLNPTAEPASPYYENAGASFTSGNTVAGKWTLIYTDAPDITSLANSSPTAQLGRIGQECTPPYIKNVIEWKRPDWMSSLPFSGTDDSRILQKVCTKAKASPSDPLQLNLDLAGIELVAPADSDGNSSGSSFFDNIQSKGLPVGLLQNNPIHLEGPLTTPFGKARILYLDDELRILKTYQNYVAVNIRSNPEWF